MAKKPTIAFVTGGYSTESVISYKSAVTIEKNLDTSRFDVYKIDITPNGWLYEKASGEKVEVNRTDFSISLADELISFDA